ncbi:MAG: hypothetical protein HKM23_03930 [Nitrosopumilus sp.]|nr:hypothetical protein [Nitrosopumilus sp.]NNL59639.1 hypothetical protein [Nitrosopumilus sp.]
MQKSLLIIGLIFVTGISISNVFSQEIGLSTFQETAQFFVDKTISQNVTASITLQTTSIQEMKIPAELEQRIRENGNISAVTLTNQNQCILGVDNQSCILINVKRNPNDKNFLQIQNTTLKVANQFIGEINKIFDTNAKLHSTFIHSSDETSKALETSGIISGKGTVSAVYTMPMEDTSSMYEKIAALLIPKEIRDDGGFYNAARDLSLSDNSKMTFSIIPSESRSLMQLRLSATYPQMASSISDINPLEFLKTDELKRSKYFSSGNYPLNSIIQVVILSPDDTNVSNVKGNILPTQMIGNELIPTDITKAGWVFDPMEGQRIQGKYIFGDKSSVSSEELQFSLGGNQLKVERLKTNFDESTLVVIIITIVAVAAAIFYLKGYRK